MSSKFYQEIISQLKEKSGHPKPNLDGFGLKYVGTQKPSFHIDTKSARTIAKDFAKNHNISVSEMADLITSLYYGKTYDEVAIAGMIVGESPALRQSLVPETLHRWIDNTHGWAECDVLCQMAFIPEDFLSHWAVWEKALKKFAQDKNIQVRRASLVLLTKPLRLSADDRLAEVALHNIDLLKSEKDILITKAVSWVLRSMIKNHKDTVAEYLKNNLDSLPKIAIREVSTKLETGKKHINKRISSSSRK